MTYNNTFKHALIGDVFQMNKYDLTKWVKVSTRTAKLIENNNRNRNCNCNHNQY